MKKLKWIARGVASILGGVAYVMPPSTLATVLTAASTAIAAWTMDFPQDVEPRQ